MSFLLKIVKRFSILIVSVLSSLLLVFSVTIANMFLTGKIFHEKKYVKTEVAVKKVEEVEKKVENKTEKKGEKKKESKK